MRVLAVDIGTGTQDILLYDSHLDIENNLKLIVPSPTMIVRRQIRDATHQGKAILLTGVTMGGGPSQWAAQEHMHSGYSIYATPKAARSFNDNLDYVSKMGIHIISEDEAKQLPAEVRRIELCDFNFSTISKALELFGVELDNLDALAVGVFDHGNAPPGVSDRKFRFDYLDTRISHSNRLSSFAFTSDNVPGIMTRLKSVVESVEKGSVEKIKGLPLIVMDTAPAAILGATFDPKIANLPHLIITNIGNLHTLAFRLGPQGIEGVFEHHTGLIDQAQLENLLLSLADGSLQNKKVFAANGHGALVYSKKPITLGKSAFILAVTGPRRNMLNNSTLRPYFAVPFGDMMLSGCIGLLAAAAELLPELSKEIRTSLNRPAESGVSPWEID